jgi:hypothetical protein
VDVTVVPAALHGTLSFDGNRNITSSTKLGFDIAGTVCDAVNYQVTGTYDVQSKGHGAFAASGILGVSSHSPFAQFGLTFVTGINFSLTGNIREHSIMIGTLGAGAGSSFAPNRGRPHSSLGPGLPEPPPGLRVQMQRQRHRFDRPSRVVAHPVVNGLHHEYRLLDHAA